jgi:hypothetical protein
LILGYWLALVLVLVAGTARANEGVGVEIGEYGIFRADIAQTVRDPNGALHNVVTNICHVSTTRVVPARMGLHFGMRYRVTGPTAGERVLLGKVVHYPTVMTPPAPEQPLSEVTGLFELAVGKASYTEYAFEQPWELVPGVWTFQLFEGERKLAELSFTVVEDSGGPLPGVEESTCFQVS